MASNGVHCQHRVHSLLPGICTIIKTIKVLRYSFCYTGKKAQCNYIDCTSRMSAVERSANCYELFTGDAAHEQMKKTQLIAGNKDW